MKWQVNEANAGCVTDREAEVFAKYNKDLTRKRKKKKGKSSAIKTIIVDVLFAEICSAVLEVMWLRTQIFNTAKILLVVLSKVRIKGIIQ